MWVVYNTDTGWSSESMRFATKREARDWINSRTMPWEFEMRSEGVMTWPTQQQKEDATNHGIEYALDQIANGNEGPQDGPLSGEWADGLLPWMVARNVGFHVPPIPSEEMAEAETELADAWENGYFETWRNHLDA